MFSSILLEKSTGRAEVEMNFAGGYTEKAFQVDFEALSVTQGEVF